MMIVICEDDNHLVTEIKNIVTKVAEKNQLDAKLDFKVECKAFDRYCDELDSIINDKIVKIYIMDVQLNGDKTGISIAKMIRKVDRNSILIFITLFNDTVNDIFASYLEVFDFIHKKGMYYERLKSAIDMAMFVFLDDEFDRRIKVVQDECAKTIMIDEITYIENESRSRDITIHILDGRVFKFKSTIAEFYQKWNTEFVQTKSNCLVNVSNIDKIITKHRMCIVLKNEEMVYHISRAGRGRLKERGIL